MVLTRVKIKITFNINFRFRLTHRNQSFVRSMSVMPPSCCTHAHKELFLVTPFWLPVIPVSIVPRRTIRPLKHRNCALFKHNANHIILHLANTNMTYYLIGSAYVCPEPSDPFISPYSLVWKGKNEFVCFGIVDGNQVSSSCRFFAKRLGVSPCSRCNVKYVTGLCVLKIGPVLGTFS